MRSRIFRLDRTRMPQKSKKRSLLGSAGFATLVIALIATTAQMPAASAQTGSGGKGLEVVHPTTPATSPASTNSPAVSPDYTAHIVERCTENGAYCEYLAGIEDTTYIYWIDVFDGTGLDGGNTGWAETNMAVLYNGESTGTYTVTNPPYIGICEEWNQNALGGTYYGWILYYAPGPEPDVDVTGSEATGNIPPAPANPIPSLGECK